MRESMPCATLDCHGNAGVQNQYLLLSTLSSYVLITIAMASSKSGMQDVSLLEHVAKAQCLNEQDEHTLQSILSLRARNTSPSYLDSDADAELLLNIEFNQAVRVRSLVLQAQERGPEKLRLRINCSAIDFTNFEDSEDTQVIELKADQVSKEGTTKFIPLHPTKFNHVNSLHVLINSEHDNTRIDVLDILGTLVHATKNLSGLAQQED
ncbi:PITH domain-containing protein [Suillus clintonianus]|uniref:PITH domain-containing protein n=1 Tax=Suillus clintonianus TaxID=1904413 RepID=UPI001B877C1A|nr:PITH domain-containing protein [Suillus clintonianus]KAG2149257.1 PITH domain-containing protein [Suillus clintonianus]